LAQAIMAQAARLGAEVFTRPQTTPP